MEPEPRDSREMRGADASPEQRVQELIGEYSGPGACAADLLCDRHPAEAVAFTVVEPDLSSRDLTYGELREGSARFAAALAALGVEPGDGVATLMGKSAEFLIALLGIWRRGAFHVPLFTAFAPPAIALRLKGSRAKLIVADGDQRSKLAPSEDIPAEPPWTVIVAGAEPRDGELSFRELMEAHSADDRSAGRYSTPACHTHLVKYDSSAIKCMSGLCISATYAASTGNDRPTCCWRVPAS